MKVLRDTPRDAINPRLNRASEAAGTTQARATIGGSPTDKTTDVLLLQIDTDEKIMFGDSGVAHLFISPDALKKQQFDQAYFQWDCC